MTFGEWKKVLGDEICNTQAIWTVKSYRKGISKILNKMEGKTVVEKRDHIKKGERKLENRQSNYLFIRSTRTKELVSTLFEWKKITESRVVLAVSFDRFSRKIISEDLKTSLRKIGRCWFMYRIFTFANHFAYISGVTRLTSRWASHICHGSISATLWKLQILRGKLKQPPFFALHLEHWFICVL